MSCTPNTVCFMDLSKTYLLKLWLFCFGLAGSSEWSKVTQKYSFLLESLNPYYTIIYRVSQHHASENQDFSGPQKIFLEPFMTGYFSKMCFSHIFYSFGLKFVSEIFLGF